MMTTAERKEVMKKRMASSGNASTGDWHFAYNIPKDIPIFKPKKGLNYIDIIPYIITNPENLAIKSGLPIGELDYFQMYGVHKGIGAGGKKEYLCEKTTFGSEKVCPLCKISDEDKASGGKGLYVNKYAVYNVIDTEDRAKGIQIWKVAYNWSERKLATLAGSYSQAGRPCDYTDFENGVTIQLNGEEKTWQNNKFIQPDISCFLPRTEQYTLEDCKKAYPIDSYYVHESVETIEAEYYGLDVTEKEAPVQTQATPVQAVVEQVQVATVASSSTPVVDTPVRTRERVRTTEPDCKMCSMGLKFGIDFSKDKIKCNNCDEAEWQACADKADDLKK